jgi:hypothetical protein
VAEFKFVANITDRHGNPMIGVDVEAIDVNLFTAAAPDPMQYVVAIVKTDISGTATFTTLPIGMYFARPRINREDVRVQVMVPSGMGGGGKMCYAALVQPNGLGTHTTIQAAVTALGITGGVIFICAGTYTENVTVAGATSGLWLIGASRTDVTIVGNFVLAAGGGAGVTGFRMEHLTLNGSAGTALLINSGAGAQPNGITLIDLRIINATTGIDMSSTSGGLNFLLDNIDMESTVSAVGTFEVGYLVIQNCKFNVAGDGLRLGGSSAVSDLRVENCTLQGGASHALRIRNVTRLVVTGCNINTTAEGVAGVLLVSAGASINIANSNLTLNKGNGIDGSTATLITGLTLENLQLVCTQPQTVDAVGIYVDTGASEVVIDGCRLSGFESYGIRFGAVQDFVISDCTIINGGDTHSIYLGGADYGSVNGLVLRGTGGAATTYGIYGAAGTTNVYIVSGPSPGHDSLTNLSTGVNNNVVIGGGGGGAGGAPTDAPYLTFGLNDILGSEVSVKASDAEVLPADNMLFKWNEPGVSRYLTLQNVGAAGTATFKIISAAVSDALLLYVGAEANPRVKLTHTSLLFGPGGGTAPGEIAIQRGTSPTLNIRPSNPGLADWTILDMSPSGVGTVTNFKGIVFYPTNVGLANGGTFIGLQASPLPLIAAGAVSAQLFGLDFSLGAIVPPTSSGIEMACAHVMGISYFPANGGNISSLRGLWAEGHTTVITEPLATITLSIGADIGNWGSALEVQTAIGLRVADQTLAAVANYLIEAGPIGAPYLRVLASGSWTPAANMTPLYLAEGAGPTLRQVRHLATQEVLLQPRHPISPGPYYFAPVDDWYILSVAAAYEIGFVWKVPADFVALSQVNIVMIPDATETIQADVDTSVAALGEDYNADTRQALNLTKAVTVNDITEWDLLAASAALFANLAANDYLAIRFQPDTDIERIVGCRIVYTGNRYMHLV